MSWNIIKSYFSTTACVSVPDMLNSDELVMKDAAVRCLEKLTKDKPGNWRSIIDSGKFIILLG